MQWNIPASRITWIFFQVQTRELPITMYRQVISRLPILRTHCSMQEELLFLIQNISLIQAVIRCARGIMNASTILLRTGWVQEPIRYLIPATNLLQIFQAILIRSLL